MPQRVAALGEQRLGGRAADAGLQRGRSRDLVEVDQLIEAPQVHGDEPARWGEAADYRRTAGIRDDGEVLLGATGQQLLHFVV